MDKLESTGLGCGSCTAVCCTVERNSMQVDSYEAFETLTALLQNGATVQDLKDLLKKNIQEFRLDKFISTGRNTLFRRKYTCPFFKHQSLGCGVSKYFKPLGCLGYNAKSGNVQNGEDCESNLDLLERSDSVIEKESLMDQEVFHFLNKDLKIIDDKQPLPIKLLEIIESLEKENLL